MVHFAVCVCAVKTNSRNGQNINNFTRAGRTASLFYLLTATCSLSEWLWIVELCVNTIRIHFCLVHYCKSHWYLAVKLSQLITLAMRAQRTAQHSISTGFSVGCHTSHSWILSCSSFFFCVVFALPVSLHLWFIDALWMICGDWRWCKWTVCAEKLVHDAKYRLHASASARNHFLILITLALDDELDQEVTMANTEMFVCGIFITFNNIDSLLFSSIIYLADFGHKL